MRFDVKTRGKWAGGWETNSPWSTFSVQQILLTQLIACRCNNTAWSRAWIFGFRSSQKTFLCASPLEKQQRCCYLQCKSFQAAQLVKRLILPSLLPLERHQPPGDEWDVTSTCHFCIITFKLPGLGLWSTCRLRVIVLLRKDTLPWTAVFSVHLLETHLITCKRICFLCR